MNFTLDNSFESFFFCFNDGNKKKVHMMLFAWGGKMQGRRIHSFTRRTQVWAPVAPLPACNNWNPLWSVRVEPVSAVGTGPSGAHPMRLLRADCKHTGDAAASGSIHFSPLVTREASRVRTSGGSLRLCGGGRPGGGVHLFPSLCHPHPHSQPAPK